MNKDELKEYFEFVSKASEVTGYSLSDWELNFLAKISANSEIDLLPSPKQVTVMKQILSSITRFIEHRERLTQRYD